MNKKGLTLIEILVAIAILGMTGLLLANLLPSALTLYSSKIDEEDVFYNKQIILDRLTREIRQGKNVIDISSSTEPLGHLTIKLSSGDLRSYSYTLYNGKYYFTVDGEIQAGPIKELRFVGLDKNLTYTTLTSSVRALSITLVMSDNKKYVTTVAMRTEEPLPISGIFITEIMYYPAPYDKSGTSRGENIMEFVVLYNANSSPISVKNWSINGNKINKSKTGSSPSDLVIPPTSYAIVVTQGFASSFSNMYNVPASYQILEVNGGSLGWNGNRLSNTTDTVTLANDSNNTIDQVNYSSTWGGNPSGNRYYSLVRKSILQPSNSATNWRSSQCLNYGKNVSNSTYYAYCLKPVVVINEIMYRPLGVSVFSDDANYEFVEISNTSDSILSLQNWKINGNNLSTVVRGSWNIPPGGYAVIGGSGSDLNNDYKFPSTYTYIRTSSSGIGSGGAALNDSSGAITITDGNSIILDEVNYSSSWGGYGYDNDEGLIRTSCYRYSLERKQALEASQDSTNWGSSTTFNTTITRRWLLIFRYDFNFYCTPATKNSLSP